MIALLEGDPERCMKVLIAKSAQPHIKAKITELCRANGIIFQNVESAALDRLTDGENHQGVAAYTAQMKLWEPEELLASLPAAPSPALILLCDHLQDPHNLGAIIRSAECVGAHGVVIPRRRSAGLTAVVGKTSAGAAEHLPVARVANISAALQELKDRGLWVYGAAAEGSSPMWETDLTGPLALVIGSEGEGLGRLVRERCDFLVSIPLRGKVGSLNASTAAAVLMYEVLRQKLAK